MFHGSISILENDLQISSSSYKKIISDALNEDLAPNGDVTSSCLIPKNHISTFQLILNEEAILAGLNVFKEVFSSIDENISFETRCNEGEKSKKSTIVASLSGSTLSLLKGERTALNFLSYLSGIATLTKKIVDLLKGSGVILLDTRKTTPTLRVLEKYALRIGGATNHRFSLSEMILIKDNHIACVDGIEKAILKAKESYSGKLKIEVEVETFEQLEKALNLKPDIIMFDNWKANDLKEAVKLVPSDILTEASGQINLDNIVDYSQTGVKCISTSYMIKNAKWVDYSFNAV